MPSFPPETIQTALKHLRAADPVMWRLIDEVGPFAIQMEQDRFGALIRAILYQQISTSAARSIRKRLEDLLAPGKITPEKLLSLSVEELRAVGVSPQKASYLLDLASKVQSGVVRLRQIGRLPDEKVIEELIQVKGIGRWSAEMFLIFHLGRSDILPLDDQGLRSAIRNCYGLEAIPDKAAILQIAAPWRPYASVASWYCWRSLDRPRKSS